MDGHRTMQKHMVFEWPRAMQKRIELCPRNVAQCHGAGFRFVGPSYAASDNRRGLLGGALGNFIVIIWGCFC